MARKELEEWFWQVDASLRRLTEAVSQSAPLQSNSRCWSPRVDLTESRTAFEMRVELAGVRAEDVQVVYLPDLHSVLVRGVRRQDAPGESSACETTGAHILEVFYGEFAREVHLPDSPVEGHAIHSTVQDGMLIIHIPKARARLAHTRVTIRKV